MSVRSVAPPNKKLNR